MQSFCSNILVALIIIVIICIVSEPLSKVLCIFLLDSQSQSNFPSSLGSNSNFVMASVLNFALRRFVATAGVRNAGTAAVSGSHEGTQPNICAAEYTKVSVPQISFRLRERWFLMVYCGVM